ncbi:MAG: sugar phosphate isomerase/epimerase, partial [Burkholderiales bacterium]|nr:sugar phosphate isomerase/epimerase [Anaerolineae bacterium]
MTLNSKLAGHTNSYHTLSFEDALAGIAAAGYKYVELSAVKGWTEHVPLDADDAALDNVRNLLNKYGLTPVSLSGHSDLTTKAGLADGLKALDLCERLGLDLMNTAIGGHYSEDEDEAGFMDNIGELADAAAAKGIIIGIEIHGDITASGKKAAAVIEKIGRDNVRINYDTANVEFYDNGTMAEDDLEYALPYMVSCHLKDHIGGPREWNFPAPGEGQINFDNLINIMTQAGYSGPLSVEVEFDGGDWPPLEEVNRSMKSAYDHLVSLGLS